MSIQGLNVNQNADVLRPDAISEDMHSLMEDNKDIDEIEENASDDETGERTRSSKDKKSKVKSNAVSLMKRELQMRDVMKNLSQEAANKRAEVVKKEVQENFQRQFQAQIQEDIKESVVSKYDDVYVSDIAEELMQKEKRFEKENSPSNQLKTSASDKILDESRGVQQGQQKQVEETHKQSQAQKNKPEVLQKTLERFIMTVSESILKETPQKKEEVKQLKQKLQKKGLSTKKLRALESRISSTIRGDLKKQLKKSFMGVAMSYHPKQMTNELLNKYYDYKAAISMAKDAGVFGPGRDNIEEIKNSVKHELRGFVRDELNRNMVKTKLKSDSNAEIMKTFDSFNNLAGFVKFDPNEYLRLFHLKMLDEGLSYFPQLQLKGHIDSDMEDTRKKRQQEEAEEQEVEDLEELLRGLYITRYTKKESFRKIIKLSYESYKVEGSLKRVGKADQLMRIRQEAKKMARFQLNVRLRGIFEERAVLPELKGPEYLLIKKQLKLTLKQLKSLGQVVSKAQLLILQHQSNRSMFTIVKEEFLKSEVFYEANPANLNLMRQRKENMMILERIKSETKIYEDIKPNLFKDLNFLTDLNVVEAA